MSTGHRDGQEMALLGLADQKGSPPASETSGSCLLGSSPRGMGGAGRGPGVGGVGALTAEALAERM